MTTSARYGCCWKSIVIAVVTALALLGTSTGGTARAADGPAPNAQASSDDAPWKALADGAIVLFRHALAPGTGDPAQFDLADCETQRNLNDEGREQARRIGRQINERGIAVGAVWTSQWCRTRETARLLDVAPVRDMPAFNSFFAERGDKAGQTALARRLLRQWQGPGALVVVTHQVNITALTDSVPRSGEGVVMRRAARDASADALDIVGRVLP